MQETEKTNYLEPEISTPEMHASKKRRVGERVVVAVKIEGNEKRQQRSECPPSDCWSWRKYGQKPIKGSPFPRGYYRCSTSRGCSAKKQVERSKTDASMLIITYTSTHNHPGPDSTNQKTEQINSQPTTPKQEQESLISTTINGEDRFEYLQSPFDSTPDHIAGENPFQENLESSIYGEDQPEPCCSDSMKLSSSSGENDFYDELEELPTTSFFTAFMKSSFCGELGVL